jgi:hypothetical protein
MGRAADRERADEPPARAPQQAGRWLTAQVMQGDIRVRPIAMEGADREAFIRLPWRLYADDPHWVPPLLMERRDFFNASKNPYFEHAQAQLFLAERGGRVTGRISAQIDTLMHKHMAPGIGQWGFLECDDDPAIAAALIGTAEEWLRKRGTTRALGPISFGMWDEPGTLIDGHGTAPLLFMGHHRPYYPALIEACGYARAKDIYAWSIDIVNGFPERINKLVSIGERNSRIALRKVDMNNFEAEVGLIIDILNEAWSDNWGYTPLTPAEKAYAVKSWKPLIVPDWVRIALYDGEPAGFMVTLPDLNEMIADLNGKIFPFGWAKLLWRLHRKKGNRVRVPIMGLRNHIKTSKQGALIVMMMIEQIRRDVVSRGYSMGECSWILDDNDGMNSILEAIGSVCYKTYRIYAKPLAG